MRSRTMAFSAHSLPALGGFVGDCFDGAVVGGDLVGGCVCDCVVGAIVGGDSVGGFVGDCVVGAVVGGDSVGDVVGDGVGLRVVLGVGGAVGISVDGGNVGA